MQHIEIDWVRHAQSCSNIGELSDKVKHPPLSYLGICQALNMNQHFVRNDNYDIIYCSSSIRTIMTALFALREKNWRLPDNEKLELVIIPYINEHKNSADAIGMVDNQNVILNIEQLNDLIPFIKSWISTKYFQYFTDPIFYNELSDIKKNLYSNIESGTSSEEINILIDKILYYQHNTMPNVISEDNDDDYDMLSYGVQQEPKLSLLVSLIGKLKSITSMDRDFNNKVDKIERFTDINFYKSCNINITNYAGAIQRQDFGINDFFIPNCISGYRKILCFSHGRVLKDHLHITKPEITMCFTAGKPIPSLILKDIENTSLIKEYIFDILSSISLEHPICSTIYRPKPILGNVSSQNNITCNIKNEESLFKQINDLMNTKEYTGTVGAVAHGALNVISNLSGSVKGLLGKKPVSEKYLLKYKNLK